MLLHTRPGRVLVVGLGTGATARAVADWPGVTVDVAEINPEVARCAPAFSPANRSVLSRVRLGDGRLLLARAQEPYDVVTLEPMPPYFAGTASLYSLEYYALARRHMAKDGVIVQWLPLHLVSPDDARMIVATMQSVFPETWVWLMPGDRTGLVVGLGRPVSPRVIAHRFARAPASARALAGDPRAILASFVLDPRRAKAFAADAPSVTDDWPILEYSGVERALGRFGSGSRLHDHNVARLRAAAR